MDIQTGIALTIVAMLISRMVPVKKQKEEKPGGTSQKKLKYGL